MHDNNELAFEANWLGNLGNLYNHTKQYAEAIQYYERAIEISRRIGDRHTESRHWGNLATAYYGLEDYDKGIQYSEKALHFDEMDIDARGYILGNLALMFWFTNKKDKARVAMRESLAALQPLKSAYEQHFRKVFVEVGLKL